MKIQILQENLIKALNTASRSISTKAQLPVLANILISSDNNQLKISATNLEMGVNLWLGAKIEGEGSVTLPAKVFQEYIASLPPGKIDLEIKENTVELSSGSYTASFNGISAKEFPLLPLPEKKIFTFPAKVLTEVIAQVAFASATDEGRPILTGVYIKKEGQYLSFAATDGYRLSVKKIAGEKPKEKEEKKEEEETKNLVIPARTLLEVSRIIADQGNSEDTVVEMSLTKDNNQAIFSVAGTELSTRLLEGEFPDYEKIIPGPSDSEVFLDKETFNKAIKTASIFARDSANIVRLNFKESKLTVSANSPQVGENKSEMEVKINNGGGEIAFNFRFLLDFLNSVESEEIIFGMTGPLNPGSFKIKDDPSFLHVIMPVRLQS